MPNQGKADIVIATTVTIMLFGGLFMVFSASSMISVNRYHSLTHFFFRQIFWAVLTLTTMIILSHYDYRKIARKGRPFLIIALTIGLLAGLFFFGVTRNGATRWYSVLGISFQPSELAKIAVIIYLASFLAESKRDINNVKERLIPLVIVLGLIIGLIIVQPDLSTSILLAIVAGSMLFISPIKFRYILSFILALVPFAVAAVMNGSYQLYRIKAWWAGLHNPLNAGYQVKQSLIGLGRGGWLGHGVGNSKQKLQFLPDSHTDFIFSILGEECGFIGTTIVILLFLTILYRGLYIASRTDNLFGKFLAIGITLNVVFYGFFNASVVSLLLPATGLPMPFLSYGGSHLLFVGVGVGILLNISRQMRPKKGSNAAANYGQRREQMYKTILTAD